METDKIQKTPPTTETLHVSDEEENFLARFSYAADVDSDRTWCHCEHAEQKHDGAYVPSDVSFFNL